MTIGRRLRHPAIFGLVFVMAACAAPPSPPSTPFEVGDVPKGDADRALERFDLEGILRAEDPGAVCLLGGGGGSGSEDHRHVDWTVTCPRPGRDRTIYFELHDAIQAELTRIATIDGSSGNLGEATEPIATTWQVRGNAYVGSVRILGVNGPADITIFVDIDLAVP